MSLRIWLVCLFVLWFFYKNFYAYTNYECLIYLMFKTPISLTFLSFDAYALDYFIVLIQHQNERIKTRVFHKFNTSIPRTKNLIWIHSFNINSITIEIEANSFVHNGDFEEVYIKNVFDTHFSCWNVSSFQINNMMEYQ